MYQIEIFNVFAWFLLFLSMLFLLFISMSYLANCFWYLTHSSSNVIWLKSKCSILLVIISVFGVLGSVPDCSDTILCMMSFNFPGRKVLRNWKVKIYFAIRYYLQQFTNWQIQKRNMKRHCLTKFLNSKLTLGFKKTYMIGFQKQFLWNETKKFMWIILSLNNNATNICVKLLHFAFYLRVSHTFCKAATQVLSK